MFKRNFRYYSTLHELVRERKLGEIKNVLRNPFSIVDVNGFNEQGELPLVIAVEQYLQAKATTEIPQLLWEWGGCYLKKDKQGFSAFWLLTSKYDRENAAFIVRPDFSLLYDAFEQCLNGCAGSARCSQCSKQILYRLEQFEQERKLSPETKALIATESLLNNYSTIGISGRFKVSEKTVIHLRTEAKNALANGFQVNLNEFFKKQAENSD